MTIVMKTFKDNYLYFFFIIIITYSVVFKTFIIYYTVGKVLKKVKIWVLRIKDYFERRVLYPN